jgi:hypothetical protein
VFFLHFSLTELPGTWKYLRGKKAAIAEEARVPLGNVYYYF